MIKRKGYKKYQTIIQQKEISSILGKGELQESYNTWLDEVENIIKQVKQVEKNRTEIPRHATKNISGQWRFSKHWALF